MTLEVWAEGNTQRVLSVGCFTQDRLSEYLGFPICNGDRIHPKGLLTAIEAAQVTPIPPNLLARNSGGGGGARIYSRPSSGDEFLDHVSLLREIAEDARIREVLVLTG